MSNLSPESRSIVEVARAEFGPTANDRQRLRERILERAVLGAASTEVEEAAREPSFWRTHGLKLIAGGALALSVFAATRFLPSGTSPSKSSGDAPAMSMQAPPPPQPTNVASPVASNPPESVPTLSPHLLPDAPMANPNPNVNPNPNPVIAARKGALPPSTRDQGSAPENTAEPVDSLGDEMRILREAHAALKSGDLGGARARLNEHTRSYPRGVFREERLALSALVFCSEGRRDEAQREAEALSRLNAHSSHLERLRGSCVAGAPPSARPAD